MNTIYLCENTVDGIFTAIYDAWSSGLGHANNYIQVDIPGYNRQLFSEYIEVKTDYEKASKVAGSIQKKISNEVYDWIFNAAVSYDLDKADAIYRVIILGFHMGSGVMEHLADDAVSHIFALNRNVGNEIMHYYGFLRFVELRNGIMLAKFNPKNDIIFFLSEHFTDRFPDENFIIADTQRNSLIFHAKGKPAIYTSTTDFDLDSVNEEYSENEQLLQDLFKTFVDSVGVKPRTNLKLQRQMLPLRFRKYMVEFHG